MHGGGWASQAPPRQGRCRSPSHTCALGPTAPVLPASPPPARTGAVGGAPTVSTAPSVPELGPRCRHDRPENPLLLLLPDPHRKAEHAQPRAHPEGRRGCRGQRLCGEACGAVRGWGGAAWGTGQELRARRCSARPGCLTSSKQPRASAAAMPRRQPMGTGLGLRRANRRAAFPPLPSWGPITGGRGRERFCREKATWALGA